MKETDQTFVYDKVASFDLAKQTEAQLKQEKMQIQQFKYITESLQAMRAEIARLQAAPQVVEVASRQDRSHSQNSGKSQKSKITKFQSSAAMNDLNGAKDKTSNQSRGDSEHKKRGTDLEESIKSDGLPTIQNVINNKESGRNQTFNLAQSHDVVPMPNAISSHNTNSNGESTQSLGQSRKQRRVINPYGSSELSMSQKSYGSSNQKIKKRKIEIEKPSENEAEAIKIEDRADEDFGRDDDSYFNDQFEDSYSKTDDLQSQQKHAQDPPQSRFRQNDVH